MGDVANGALTLCAVALGKDPGTESGVYFVKLDAAYNGELTGRRLAELGSSNIPCRAASGRRSDRRRSSLQRLRICCCYRNISDGTYIETVWQTHLMRGQFLLLYNRERDKTVRSGHQSGNVDI